jgi:hypothetical protein
LAFGGKAYGRLTVCGGEIVDADVVHFKVQLATGFQTSFDQIFQDFVLGIDEHGFATGKIFEIDAVAATEKLQFDAAVHESLGLEALADADLNEQVDGALFEDAGADAFFDVGAAFIFENDGVDAVEIQHVRKQEAGWPGAYDSDLGFYRHDAVGNLKSKF